MPLNNAQQPDTPSYEVHMFSGDTNYDEWSYNIFHNLHSGSTVVVSEGYGLSFEDACTKAQEELRKYMEMK